MSDEIILLKIITDKSAVSATSSSGDADLYIADESGYAIVKFMDGNIKTENFDSSKNASAEERGLMSQVDKSKLDKIEDGAEVNDVSTKSTAEDYDYGIADEDGNVLAQFKDGHFKTKNFDSRNGSGSGNTFWNGKKVVWNGDSISYGSQLSDVTKAYPYLVASSLGMTLVNYAIGGTNIAKGADSTYMQNEGGINYDEVYLDYAEWQSAISAGTLDTSKKYLVKDNITSVRPYGIYTYSSGSWTKKGTSSTLCGRTPLVDRIAEMDKDADLVVIACGSNDFFYMWSDFGTIDSTDKTSFYGALKNICEYLLANYINKQIVFINCIKRYQPEGKSNAQWTETLPLLKNPVGHSMEEYNSVIKEVCDYYSIPVVDMYAISGMNPFYDTSLFADTDGKHVHPNVEGHKRMASYMVAFLNSLRS